MIAVILLLTTTVIGICSLTMMSHMELTLQITELMVCNNNILKGNITTHRVAQKVRRQA